MKATALPIVLSTAALGGVLVLFLTAPESAPQRRQEPAAPPREVAALQARVDALEREVARLRTDRASAVALAAPAKADDTETPRAATPEPRPDAAAKNDRRSERKPDDAAERRQRRADWAERRRTNQLQRLVDDEKITALTEDQRTKLDATLRGARDKMAVAFAALRSDPGYAELSREERREEARKELAKVREEIQKEMEGYLPANDAEIVAEALLRRGGGNNRRNRGNRRRGND